MSQNRLLNVFLRGHSEKMFLFVQYYSLMFPFLFGATIDLCCFQPRCLREKHQQQIFSDPGKEYIPKGRAKQNAAEPILNPQGLFFRAPQGFYHLTDQNLNCACVCGSANRIKNKCMDEVNANLRNRWFQ